jgi:hypothetical protein
MTKDYQHIPLDVSAMKDFSTEYLAVGFMWGLEHDAMFELLLQRLFLEQDGLFWTMAVSLPQKPAPIRIRDAHFGF